MEHGCLTKDIGVWSEVMTRDNIDYCIKMGDSTLQNCDNDILESRSLQQEDVKVFVPW